VLWSLAAHSCVQVAAGEARLARHAAWAGSKLNPDRALVHERTNEWNQAARMAVYKVGRRPDETDS
jgi:hypothetical protein